MPYRGCGSGSCIHLNRAREGAFSGGRFRVIDARACTPMMTLSALHAVIPLWPPFWVVVPIKTIKYSSLRREGRGGILIVDRCIADVKPYGPISGTKRLWGRGGIGAPIRRG